MGLDMYLYLERYDSVIYHEPNSAEKAKALYPPELGKLAERNLNHNFLSRLTKYQVAYWRRAYAIHQWFADNCGNGDDNCEFMYVGVEQAKELLRLINEVLEHPEKADLLLPNQFFEYSNSMAKGEYDKWYFNDLRYTKEVLEDVIPLAEGLTYDIYYRASY